MPPDDERAERLRVVLHVLYLIFNEGYTASSGPDLQRAELTTEAIRLARDLHRLLPDDGEVAGLLALMLLTDARRPARTAARRQPGPARRTGPRALESTTSSARAWRSSPTRWRGRRSVRTRCRRRSPPSTTKRRAPRRRTGAQIVVLYELLAAIAPNPMVTLNQAVAVAMVRRPAGRASTCWQPLDADERMAGHHRLEAVRAHLLEMAGDHVAARASYRTAARRTTSLPEQRYLEARAARLMDAATVAAEGESDRGT